MFPVTILLVLLISTNCAAAENSSIMSTVPRTELILNPKTQTRRTRCNTNDDCGTNRLCIHKTTHKYCSQDSGQCSCVTACDSADDCPNSKCASGGEGNDFPFICFSCSSIDKVIKELPKDNCPTDNCYDTGCKKGHVCVERDFGRYTMCRASNRACSCSLACDGTGICREHNAQCGIYAEDGIKSLQLCFTCTSVNITVVEGEACKPTEPSTTAIPQSMGGQQPDNDTPIALIVGISLSLVSVIIVVLLLLICRRSENTNHSNTEGPVKNVFVFRKIHVFFRA